MGVEEASNPEIIIGADIKTSNRSLLPLAKRPGKRQPSNMENLDNNQSTPAKHPHPHQQRLNGKSKAIMWVPAPLQNVRDGKAGSLGFHPHPTAGGISQWGRRPSGEPGHSPWPSSSGALRSFPPRYGTKGGLLGNSSSHLNTSI